MWIRQRVEKICLKTSLVVEDDPELSAHLKCELENRGYGVSVAPDLATANAVLQDGAVDAMVIDRMLPDGDGLAFLKYLRASNNELPTVILSALSETNHRIDGLTQGADDYLCKPFDAGELVARIEAVTRRARGDASEAHVVRRVNHRHRQANRHARRARDQTSTARIQTFELYGAPRRRSRDPIDAVEARLGNRFRPADERRRRARQSSARETGPRIQFQISAYDTRQGLFISAARRNPRTMKPGPMRFRHLMHSSVFRATALFVVILTAAMVVLGVYVDWRVSSNMNEQINSHIDSEVEALAEAYQRSGLSGLLRVIDERVAREPARASIYLARNHRGALLAGNLSQWPQASADARGWIEFDLYDQASQMSTRARVRPFQLASGIQLLVGRDLRHLIVTRDLIRQSLIWGVCVTLLIGWTSAAFFSRSMRRKLNRISATSRRVVAGDMSQTSPLGW